MHRADSAYWRWRGKLGILMACANALFEFASKTCCRRSCPIREAVIADWRLIALNTSPVADLHSELMSIDPCSR
jgi:hypothetical protein